MHLHAVDFPDRHSAIGLGRHDHRLMTPINHCLGETLYDSLRSGYKMGWIGIVYEQDLQQ